MRKLLFFILWFTSLAASKAEVLELSLAEAEGLFQHHCMELLARRFEIDKAEAQVVQARLFENLVVSLEQNVYNSINGRYFDMGKEGEFIVEVEQMIDIARLRGKRVKLECKNRQVAEQEFEELVRTLRAVLREKFVELYFTRLSADVYGRQVVSLKALAEAVGTQAANGNIPLHEKLRMESMLLSVGKEQRQLLERASALEADLRLLLSLKATEAVVPSIRTDQLSSFFSVSVSLDSLSDLLPRRPDVQLAGRALEAASLDLKLQCAQAFPEMSLKAAYDKAGNFIENYWAVGASFTVPIFNRNQGGVKAARVAVEQGKHRKEQAQSIAENELQTAWTRLLRAEKAYRECDFSLERNFAEVMESVNHNYQRRNITLLEFIDYYESNTTAIMNLFDLRHELISAIESVNDAVNQRVFDIKY